MSRPETSRALRNLAVAVGLWIGWRVLSAGFAGPEFAADSPKQQEQRPEPVFAMMSSRPADVRTTTGRHVRPAGRSRAGRLRPAMSESAEEAITYPQRLDREPLAGVARDHREKSNLVDVSSAKPEFRKGTSQARNWSLSAWAIVRPGPGPVSLATNGQLGGSQAGFRIQRRAFDLGKAVRLSANVRVSAPLLQARGKEAGIGLVARRSGPVPVELLFERRVAIDNGGRNAFAVLAATGVNDVRLPLGFRLNGYGQAGFVGARRRDGFADGSIQVERQVSDFHAFKLSLGGGAWGAVQPRVSRLDVGPFVAARFRLAGASVRLSSEWRRQMAGNAVPGSGPALSIGLDY